ncbi:hypothetical protein Q8A73_009512 [Channa argus]|nr:hypothetical protein Q8A73_009512 [Channa argus]
MTASRHRNHAYNNLHEEVIGNLRDLGLLRPRPQRPGPQPSVSPDAGGQVRGRRKRCSRKRKRGKQAGVRARLNANPSRPALPSLLLSNVCSLDNKLEYIPLQRTTRREFRDCFILVFTSLFRKPPSSKTGLMRFLPTETLLCAAITNYKTTSSACDRDTSLPDALNHFYARFKVQNNVKERKSTPPPSDQVFCLTTAEVRKTLRRVNPRKSAGPDNIPNRVLRECAEQLAHIFTDIFNIFLSSNVVPTCLRTTTIVPVPKKSSVSCLNDYRPVALTPIVMKCFERLVMWHIKSQLPTSLDPMQFAYFPNRSTDDAISTTLHLALTHLDNKDSYVRMLFIDFSSAFNTIIPQHLIKKLSILGLNTYLCNWILDFLTGRPQSVRIGNNISSTTTLSTGVPQGCVLSPLLFTLLTHNCVAMHSLKHIIKFADDTTVVGLISKNDESAYRKEVQRLTARCGANNLSLNVDKTKEMVVDFRRAQSDHSPLIIDGSLVEIVKSTKFLGVHLADNLTLSVNTSSITKKAEESPSPSHHPDHVLQRDH